MILPRSISQENIISQITTTKKFDSRLVIYLVIRERLLEKIKGIFDRMLYHVLWRGRLTCKERVCSMMSMKEGIVPETS